MQFIVLLCLLLLKGLLPGKGQEDTVTGPSLVLDCPEDQVLSNCSISLPLICQERCFGLRPYPCPPIRCYSYPVDCICREGYIREEANGRCIPKGDCAALCHDHEEYSECGSGCTKTCDGVFPEDCVERGPFCIKSCDCEGGFIRKTLGGPCILPTDC